MATPGRRPPRSICTTSTTPTSRRWRSPTTRSSPPSRQGLRAQGLGADGDRAARPPRARTGAARATSTCCAATSRRSGSPASRSSATTSTTTRAACRRRSGCSACSTRDRRAARDHRRRGPDRHAHRRRHRDRRAPPRAAATRRCSGTSARAAPRTGTCGCSTTSSSSTRSASTRAGPRAATRSPRGSRTIVRAAGRRHRRLGVVRARRRHRRRGVAARAARAAAAHRVDRARRARRALRDDERRRAVAAPTSWTRSSSTTGASARAGPFGALRAHVDAGRLSRETLHAELGEIVAGAKPGRERDDETILFWHRGLTLSDIALGARDAREGAASGHRPDAALPLTGTSSRAMLVANARMYSATPAVKADWKAARLGDASAPACPGTDRLRRAAPLDACGRATTWASR